MEVVAGNGGCCRVMEGGGGAVVALMGAVTRTLDELLLDDALNLLAPVSNVIDLLGVRGGHDDERGRSCD